MISSYIRTEARVLRRRGNSLRQISDRLDISKSTASLWTKDVVLSELGIYRVNACRDRARERSAVTLHQRKLNRVNLADMEANAYINGITKETNISIVALATMYYCEGMKDDSHLAFTNSDPELVCTFINLLVGVFKIKKDKLKICLHIHDYHNEKEMLAFWSSAIGVPITQFTKSFLKPSNHLYSAKGYKGCVRVSYYDSHVARVILAFAKKFVKLYI